MYVLFVPTRWTPRLEDVIDGALCEGLLARPVVKGEREDATAAVRGVAS